MRENLAKAYGGSVNQSRATALAEIAFVEEVSQRRSPLYIQNGSNRNNDVTYQYKV